MMLTTIRPQGIQIRAVDTTSPVKQLEHGIEECNVENVDSALQEASKINSDIEQVITHALMADGENCPGLKIQQLLVKYLLTHTAFEINACLQDGKRLLDVAVENDDEPFVKFLLNENADPALLDASIRRAISEEMQSLLYPQQETSTASTPTLPAPAHQEAVIKEPLSYAELTFRSYSGTTTFHDELTAETKAYNESLLIDPAEIFNKDTQDFSKIISIRRSTLGANGGVFFVTGKSGAIIAIKVPLNSAAEFFAYELADTFGLNAPQRSVLDTNSEVFETLVKRIETINLHTDCSATSESIRDFKQQLNQLKKQSSTLMVMDFLNGRSLADSRTKTENFSPEAIFKSPDILNQFGENLVFDFLCCHRDRFAYTGEKNAGNIFLTSSFKYFIIDQSVSNIQDGPFDQFKEEFRRLLSAFSDESSAMERAPYIDSIKNFISKNSGITVLPSHEQHIQNGIWAGIKKAALITREKLIAIQEKHASITGMDKVNINGILEMVSLCPSLDETPTTTLTPNDMSIELKQIGGDDAYKLRTDLSFTQQLPPPSPQVKTQKQF